MNRFCVVHFLTLIATPTFLLEDSLTSAEMGLIKNIERVPRRPFAPKRDV